MTVHTVQSVFLVVVVDKKNFLQGSCDFWVNGRWMVNEEWMKISWNLSRKLCSCVANCVSVCLTLSVCLCVWVYMCVLLCFLCLFCFFSVWYWCDVSCMIVWVEQGGVIVWLCDYVIMWLWLCDCVWVEQAGAWEAPTWPPSKVFPRHTYVSLNIESTIKQLCKTHIQSTYARALAHVHTYMYIYTLTHIHTMTLTSLSAGSEHSSTLPSPMPHSVQLSSSRPHKPRLHTITRLSQVRVPTVNRSHKHIHVYTHTLSNQRRLCEAKARRDMCLKPAEAREQRLVSQYEDQLAVLKDKVHRTIYTQYTQHRQQTKHTLYMHTTHTHSTAHNVHATICNTVSTHYVICRVVLYCAVLCPLQRLTWCQLVLADRKALDLESKCEKAIESMEAMEKQNRDHKAYKYSVCLLC